MTEESAQQAPAPAWAQAMKGKPKGLPPASKRMFVIISMVFFGAFLWLYVIYNLRHSPSKEEKVAVATAPAATDMTLPAIEMTPGLQPFGMPRGAQTTGTQAQYVPMQGGSVAMEPSPTPTMPGAPAGMSPSSMQLSGAGGMPMGAPMPVSAQYQNGYQQPARQYRSDAAIVAPIHYRHAISDSGMALGNQSAPAPRQRMYVSR